jgi:transglutaminase-like putative cysteine protease
MSSKPKMAAVSTLHLGSALLLIACLYMNSLAASDDHNLLSSPNFSMEAPLYGRYPELVRQAAYKAWRAENEIGAWHETQCIDDRRQVIIQSAAQADRLFVAEMQRCASALRSSVRRAEALDVSGTPESREAAMKAFSATHPPESITLRAVQPVVNFSQPKAKVSWEFDFRTAKERLRMQFKDGKKIKTTKVPAAQASMPAESADLLVLDAPHLASNELHHVQSFQDEALKWTEGATTIHDKAKRIYNEVKNNYRYNTQIEDIKEFTWSDQLVRTENNYAGICDEWAVVQISYLRSLGIPARMILLKWLRGLTPEAHAALEFQDEQLRWHHMDALFGFDDPDVYRRDYDAREVKVVLATNPDDSRSTAHVEGKPDLNGDGKLSLFGDFELQPLYLDTPNAGGYNN